MEFNRIVRGNKRESSTENSVYEILDAGFLCHIAFVHEDQAMMIPTAYGRKDDVIYIHGSTKNFMMNALLNGQTSCLSVTHLDGIVLARSMFHASANYRSVVAFGKAVLVENEDERMEGLKIISGNIAQGRWDEVIVGTESELKATMVIKIPIERVSAKVRNEGPNGDGDIETGSWSGHIPLELKALEPCPDKNRKEHVAYSPSVQNILDRFS